MVNDNYKQRSYEHKATFTAEVKEKLRLGVADAIDALVYEAKHSKNSQARVAAARQVIRMAYVAGVLEKNEFADLLHEFGTEFDKIEVS
jgi:hypothetical protein